MPQRPQWGNERPGVVESAVLLESACISRVVASGMDSLITILLAPIVLIIVSALALSAVTFIVKGWTRLYTIAAPEHERESRRAEADSVLHEERSAFRAEGYKPAEVAVRVLLRMALRVRSDMAWLAPYLPTALAERLAKGDDALSRVRTPTRMVSSLAVLGLMNWSFYMSDDDLTWMGWLLLNVGMLAMFVVMWNDQRRWARRVLYSLTGLATVMATGVVVWVTFQYRLYEIPLFYQYVLAMLPVLLAMVVADKSIRVRFFRDRWWPVFVCWFLMAVASLGAALISNLTAFVTAWKLMAAIVLALVTATAIFTVGTFLVWYVGTRVIALGMRQAARGIRTWLSRR